MPASTPKPYRVGRSKTGLGLFATQPIRKGAKIIRYFGPMLDCRKSKDDAVENKYLFQITKRWTVDGSVRKNIARYINHGCKPNAESDVNTKKLKITIRAIKNIAPGDEINYDYGTEYFKEYLKPIGCKCDACEKKRGKKKLALRAEKAGLRAKDKAKAERKALKAGDGKTKTPKTKTPKTKTPKTKTLKTKTLKTKALKTRALKTRALKSDKAASGAAGKGKAASAKPKAVAGKAATSRARKSSVATAGSRSAAGPQAQAA
jgi:hypothetical protein